MARAAEMEIITEPARCSTMPTAGGLDGCYGNRGLLGHSSLGLAPFLQPNICFLKGCRELTGVVARGERASISNFGKRKREKNIQKRNKLGQASNKGEGNVFINTRERLFHHLL